MTLVLTEASEFGIAMAADSSATSQDGRSMLGFQKLLPIRSLNAGISAWGAGRIGNERTDVWLQHFIQNNVEKEMTLWQVAENLAEELNAAFKQPLEFHSGMHVAGYDRDDQGNRFPAIYHIHNGHYHVSLAEGKIIPVEPEPIREFRAHRDHPPRRLEEDETFILRNGDFFLFAQLNQMATMLFDYLQEQISFTFPYPPRLETRGEYLRIWIDFISQLYRHSNWYPHDLDVPITGGGASIGGPISVLTIDSQGIRSFYMI